MNDMAKNFRIQDPGARSDMTRPIDARGNAVYTQAEVDRINALDNRRHITGTEMEAMMGMIAAGNLMTQCAKMLSGHAAHIGSQAALKRLVTQLRNLIVRLNMHVETRQMGAIASQMADANITISANPRPAMVNICLDDLLHICNRAMEQCDFCCTCTREQSKACDLRKAFDMVPGARQAAKDNARKDANRCPYRGMEIDICEGDAYDDV